MTAGQQARMTEDELYEALADAKAALDDRLVPAEWLNVHAALLEQVRWRCEHEWPRDSQFGTGCIECGNAEWAGHRDDCSVGLTVRAAARAGLAVPPAGMA